MKLTPRMVPEALWGVALRKELGSRWLPEVSRPIRGHQVTCEICGGYGQDSPNGWRTCCDEVWDYSDADPVFQEVLPMLAFGPDALPSALSVVPEVASRVLDKPPQARLTGLQCICWRCNAMVHYGFTEATSDWPTRKLTLLHGERVNGVSTSDMLAEVVRAKTLWAVRSEIPGWTITWDGWERIRDRKAGRKRRPLPGTLTLDRAFTFETAI